MHLKNFLFATVLSATLAVESFFPTKVFSQAPASIPDLSRITFRSLPAQQPGSFHAPPEVVNALGYNPSRSWYTGQTADQIMQLGDFTQSLGFERYSLRYIEQLTGIETTRLRLSDVGLLSWQTIGDLVNAIPDIANYRIADIAPIADLLSLYGVGFSADNLIADILGDQSLSALPLNSLNLSQYSLASLPGLETTPFGYFRDWQRSTISQVPGLNTISLGTLFRMSNNTTPAISLVDIVFGTAENDRNWTVSGSYQEGFNVPCERECAHIELGQPFLGMQWISGKYQEVQGGFGVLAVVNGGKEPTGRHPYGDDFKVVIWETDEASGTAEQALFFRFCKGFLGCTPYFIGPFPWFPLEEEGFIVL